MERQVNMTVDGLTPDGELSALEMEAWGRLEEAERALAIARQDVINVTNRESNKRRMRPHRHLLGAADTQ
jgi:hypothetical protein